MAIRPLVLQNIQTLECDLGRLLSIFQCESEVIVAFVVYIQVRSDALLCFEPLCFECLLFFLSLLAFFFGRQTHQLLLVSTTLSVRCLLERRGGGERVDLAGKSNRLSVTEPKIETENQNKSPTQKSRHRPWKQQIGDSHGQVNVYVFRCALLTPGSRERFFLPLGKTQQLYTKTVYLALCLQPAG